MSGIRNDRLKRLLAFVLDRMPPPLRPWAQAMLAELAVIQGFWSRLSWSLGLATTLMVAWLRFGRGPGAKEDCRLEISLIAGYQFLFSAVLIGILTWQLPQITEAWKYAVPALIICYTVSAVPAVLGFGLALRDEAARVGTVILSIAHALLNLEYMRRGLSPYAEPTALRIVIDVVIIIALNQRKVRQAFQMNPIMLHLSG